VVEPVGKRRSARQPQHAPVLEREHLRLAPLADPLEPVQPDPLHAAEYPARRAYHPIEDSRMTALGLVLLLLGATLVVVEAHVPGGVAGVAGGLALVAGGIVAVAGAGGSLALAVPVGIGVGVAVAGWMLLAATKT